MRFDTIWPWQILSRSENAGVLFFKNRYLLLSAEFLERAVVSTPCISTRSWVSICWKYIFLKQTCISKRYLLQKEQFLISLVGIHFVTLQDWSYYSFPLFQTQVFQDLQHLNFFSTLILRERAALKMHHSLKNIRMSRYRNGAVFNLSLNLWRWIEGYQSCIFPI